MNSKDSLVFPIVTGRRTKKFYKNGDKRKQGFLSLPDNLIPCSEGTTANFNSRGCQEEAQLQMVCPKSLVKGPQRN